MATIGLDKLYYATITENPTTIEEFEARVDALRNTPGLSPEAASGE